MTDNDRLKECVKEFFTYLDYQEESDSGVMFNPITISCCRVMKIKPLNKLLDEMKALSNN
jgi:3'-phosphoadenosine 5'-phosphosulfate sulfotransferase (PAPS reductase)/FAD synthetase